MFNVDRSRLAIIVFLVLIFAGMKTGTAEQSSTRNDTSAPVWQLTYLKAEKGQRERLERFITLNWFGPDDRARDKGYIDGFLLLRGSDEDPT